MNVEVISYELGVFMFNVAHGINKDFYDAVGNFESLFLALGKNLYEHKVLDGFISEAENFGIDNEEAKDMYEKFRDDLGLY